MIRKIKFIGLYLAVAVLPVTAIFSHTVFAQSSTNNDGQALEIGPPVITRTVDPGDSIDLSISLRNVSPNKLIVKSEVNDFVASGEDGTPRLLIDSDEPSPYSIIDWVRFIPDLSLESKELKNLSVTIDIPSNAAPGGYFGSIRFTSTAPELQDTGVSLSASLGTLILLEVNGDAVEKLSIEEFTTVNSANLGSLFESAPINFTVRIKNEGNLHLQPTGQISITDMFGNKTAVVNVNLAKNNILPQSIRKFDQLLLDKSVIGDKFLFGKYTADLKMSYGSNSDELTSSLTFWVIPYKLIAIIIILIIVTFIVLRLGIKRYNKHIIDQSRKTNSKK